MFIGSVFTFRLSISFLYLSYKVIFSLSLRIKLVCISPSYIVFLFEVYTIKYPFDFIIILGNIYLSIFLSFDKKYPYKLMSDSLSLYSSIIG